MSIQHIHGKITNLYSQIEDLTKESPIAAIIYSVAIKTFSVIACSFSNSLGLGIFLFSLCFDFALITNLTAVTNKIENYFLNIFECHSSEERAAKAFAASCKTTILHAKDSIKGFFNGFFTEI